ncbi:MAG: type II toxin-antitoxin system HicB family antitoxin [Clostridia bacterium]|nr:type II toxin-antitoxin system HicB family antitoxin [Clostridia bacterium]
MIRDHYVYPAVFTFGEDGISVEFPDLPGCFTCGSDVNEAVQMAKEALALHLYGLEEDGDPLPEPSPPNRIKAEANQAVMLVETWMPPLRSEIQNRAVKKTLTIPKWLNDLAERQKVNFSQVLQEALKRHLGVTTYKDKVDEELATQVRRALDLVKAECHLRGEQVGRKKYRGTKDGTPVQQ